MENSQNCYAIKTHMFHVAKLPCALYVVSTPIGNLRDITLRALETLAGVDIIACEDTRTSGILLKAYGIETQKTSYHEHNAAAKSQMLLEALQAGKSIAIISDAGTPLISDPGQHLVQVAAKHGFEVFAIPGASAILAGLVSSGISSDEFMFVGFLPTKAGQRETKLAGLKSAVQTLIFYESPKRILKTLEAMKGIFGEERKIALSRELTKLHESHYRGTIDEVLKTLKDIENLRGEMVLCVAGAIGDDWNGPRVDALLIDLMGQMSLSKAASEAAKLSGQSKRELYQRALELNEKG